MIAKLSNFAARLGHVSSQVEDDDAFNEIALELFALQFKHNPAYQKICAARDVDPRDVRDWTQIPFVPTAAFKELELTSIPSEERTAVFHSSGTTEQKPSSHFHCAASLEVYEASLWKSFETNVLSKHKFDLIVLTPPAKSVPHSSLVHMFETVRQNLGAPDSAFVGSQAGDGAWLIDFDAALAALGGEGYPKLILGTAFSFVHLLDYLAEKNLRLELPRGSCVMETGGYKNRSRALPRTQLHSLITTFLGIHGQDIICEYGMSELSSQAYDTFFLSRRERTELRKNQTNQNFALVYGEAGIRKRTLHFPSWTRVQIISPETGREVADGETGLIRILDLANVFSVAAIQTEDLGIKQGRGFELVGRAALAEPRGCSLQTA
jgi:hypothetical protein